MIGYLWIALGAIILAGTVVVSHYQNLQVEDSAKSWILDFLAVLLNPAGWYFLWEGFGWIFFR
jgi:hypothetical protein